MIRFALCLHPYAPNLHFKQFDRLLIARRSGTRQQLAEWFVVCCAVSFADLINLRKYPFASILVHCRCLFLRNHFLLLARRGLVVSRAGSA